MQVEGVKRMLKNKQKLLAELMVEEPELSNFEYADRIDINIKTLYAWKKQEEFQDYLHSCCKDKFKSMEKLAIERLRDNIDKGNIKAITYLLDYMGFKAADEVKADLNASIEIDYGE